MDLSRRFFIGSALSFTAFSGCRVFRAPGGLFSGAPKLKFGVVSDMIQRIFSRGVFTC